MKNRNILFFVRSAKYLKAMQSFVEELIHRGFVINVVYDPGEGDTASLEILERFKRKLPGFSYEAGLRRKGYFNKRITRALRGLVSYRKFLILDGQNSFYTKHWFKFLPHSARRILLSAPFLLRVLAMPLTRKIFNFCERILPVDRGIMSHILHVNPAAVVVAYRGQPPGSADTDYLKAAKKLGIVTVVPVASWDALTTKGVLHIQPDVLLVWNEKQKRDSVKHHSLQQKTIKIVGAFQFDDWFNRAVPFAENTVGVNKAVFYIASGALSGDTISVAETLRREMDSDQILKDTPLIVRPPLYGAHTFRTSKKNIILIPSSYEGISGDKSVDLFLRAISLSFVAVGIHTTGLIDAMFKGLPVIIYSPPEFRAAQDVPHFRELLENDVAERARDAKEFLGIARDIAFGKDRKRAERERFIQTLRPPEPYASAAAAAADCIENALQKR